MTLPESTIDIAVPVEFVEQPALTWGIDKATQHIVGAVDEYEAIKQAVSVILNVERFQWQIYQPYSGVQLAGLVGQDAGYVAAEVQRRVREAVMVDERVTGVSNYSYTINGNKLAATMAVNTVFGDIQIQTEVNIA